MGKSISIEFLDEIRIVKENMEKHGGGFDRALAKALMLADSENSIKIKDAWPDLWDLYLNWDRK